jgi:putative membrane protein
MGAMRFLVHVLVVGLALAVAARIVPGIEIDSLPVLVVAAVVLGVVNAIVRPVLVLVTLPLTILTLGLFYLVVNGVAFALAALLVPGFGVRTLTAAILGALVVSIVSWVAGAFTPKPER